MDGKPTSHEERAKLAFVIYAAEKFLAGQSLEWLEDQVVPKLPWIFSSPSETAGKLLGFIEGSLALIGDKAGTEAEFRAELEKELLKPEWHPQSPAGRIIWATYGEPPYPTYYAGTEAR